MGIFSHLQLVWTLAFNLGVNFSLTLSRSTRSLPLQQCGEQTVTDAAATCSNRKVRAGRGTAPDQNSNQSEPDDQQGG